jgi:hypothetical protein
MGRAVGIRTGRWASRIEIFLPRGSRVWVFDGQVSHVDWSKALGRNPQASLAAGRGLDVSAQGLVSGVFVEKILHILDLGCPCWNLRDMYRESPFDGIGHVGGLDGTTHFKYQ